MLSSTVSTPQEEAKLAAMQRALQPNNRRPTTFSLFDGEDLDGLLLSSTNATGQVVCESSHDNMRCASMPSSSSSVSPIAAINGNGSRIVRNCLGDAACETDVDDVKPCLKQVELFKEPTPEINGSQPFDSTPSSSPSAPASTPAFVTLNAADLNDFPAAYKIAPLEPHQFPAVGVYVDRRIVPGFKYRVRQLPELTDAVCGQQRAKYLFGGRALTLRSIGRGYARRFTFDDTGDAYFWSDNRPEGYAFELEAVSECDKFTVCDVDGEEQGTAEVLKVEGAQLELEGGPTPGGFEKRVKVKFIAKVEFYETGVAKPMPLSAVAVCRKKRGVVDAQIVRLVNVNMNHHRYHFVPGYQSNRRRVTVRGADIGDVPTKYTMTGLEPYEIPVVGTYVDPRVVPGFHYRVRPNDRKRHLFDGRPLKLLSIGMGYAKRLTFEPDSALKRDNYLWSDNHPDGLGLEPSAVRTGMRFIVIADGRRIVGEATVFRADLPQREERMEKVPADNGKGSAIVKYIHVNVVCHMKLMINGGTSFGNDELMRVYGLAVVRKEPYATDSRIVRLENVGLDSQLNLLFARSHTELTFEPL